MPEAYEAQNVLLSQMDLTGGRAPAPVERPRPFGDPTEEWRYAVGNDEGSLYNWLTFDVETRKKLLKKWQPSPDEQKTMPASTYERLRQNRQHALGYISFHEATRGDRVVADLAFNMLKSVR